MMLALTAAYERSMKCGSLDGESTVLLITSLPAPPYQQLCLASSASLFAGSRNSSRCIAPRYLHTFNLGAHGCELPHCTIIDWHTDLLIHDAFGLFYIHSFRPPSVRMIDLPSAMVSRAQLFFQHHHTTSRGYRTRVWDFSLHLYN